MAASWFDEALKTLPAVASIAREIAVQRIILLAAELILGDSQYLLFVFLSITLNETTQSAVTLYSTDDNEDNVLLKKGNKKQ